MKNSYYKYEDKVEYVDEETGVTVVRGKLYTKEEVKNKVGKLFDDAIEKVHRGVIQFYNEPPKGKGVSKTMEDDSYDRNTGIKIASLKAQKRAFEKQLDRLNSTVDSLTELLNYVETMQLYTENKIDNLSDSLSNVVKNEKK